MRKLRLLFIFFVACSWFFISCKKNYSEEIYKPITNPVIPDFATKVNAAVAGFITDENGNAVEGAAINGAGVTVTSDKYGYFKISSAAFAKSAGFVQVSRSGYFTGYKTFLPVQSKESFIRLQLIPKKNAGSINTTSGGTVITSDGAKITLPADAVVTASTNAAYTGDVNVAAHWLNPAETQITNLTMPGNLTGIDSAGHFNVLQTFGMLAVELTGSGGQLLQIAAGKKASLHFPIPDVLMGSAPSAIPLWYFDETKGVWKQEGYAIKNGSSYEGDVNHFSYWNCDVGLPLVNFTAQIVDNELNPLSNVQVSVSIGEQPNSSRFSYTDTNGLVTGLVPANSSLQVKINTPCNQSIVVNTISTANEPVDLGTVSVNTQQYAGVLKGTATDCNGSPVTDGYVFVTNFGYNSIIAVTNGSFSISGTFCPGASANFVAYDRATSAQSSLHTVQLVKGVNDVGELQACTAPATEIIQIEGRQTGASSFTLPQYMFGGNFYFANDSTSINVIDLLNSNQQVLQFSFTGPAAPGSYPLSGNSLVYNGQSIEFISSVGIPVTVTTYGLNGQFIAGSFSGNASVAGGPVAPVFVSFNIKRDQ